jgi:hypothetical protein
MLEEGALAAVFYGARNKGALVAADVQSHFEPL